VQITEGRPAMGTVLEITLVASDEPRARAALARCFAETERLEAIFTTWREDGELARLNARAGRGPQPASRELVQILLDSQRFASETDGAFDVTVEPLLRLWREAGERDALPDDDSLSAARARVGAARIDIDARRSTVALEEGTAASLGAIAKGWTLDRLAELLRADGISRALLNFGGSSLHALGAPLDAPAWRVATESGVLELTPGSNVSISSSFGQFVEIGGERLSHIVDPRSGWPIRREVRTTAWARTGAEAEAASTAQVVRNGEHCTPADIAHRSRATRVRIECGP
jgi:thiamine biosynthesis lipoprotein